MVSSEKDADAIEALREVYANLQKLYDAHTDDFLFFNRMHAPIKRIQGKFRYQVLMRLTSDALLEAIYDAVSAVKPKNALVSVEENPSNLS